MALSFSFPTGKVKKGDSFSSATRTTTDSGDLGRDLDSESPTGLYDKSGKQKGPKAWKSFPSLAFFKDSINTNPSKNTNSTSASATESSNSRLYKATSNKAIVTGGGSGGSKLPIRATSVGASASAFTIGKTSIPSKLPTSLVINTLSSIPSATLNRKIDGVLNFEKVEKSRGEEKVRLSTGKSLPDVTDTESPKLSSSEKPCDLLAQIQSLNSKEDGLESPDLRMEPGEFVNRGASSSFDDNGNPFVVPQQQQHQHQQNAHHHAQHPVMLPEREINQQAQEVKALEIQGKSKDQSQQPSSSRDGKSCKKEQTVVVSPSESAEKPLIQGESPDDSIFHTNSDSKPSLEGNPEEIHSSNLSSNNSTSTSRELNTEDLQEKETEDDEPKYFINAAALSEDDTFVLPPSPAPSPCSFDKTFSRMMNLAIGSDEKSISRNPSTSEDACVVDADNGDNQATPTAESSHSPTKSNKKKLSSVFIRPRVPVSKSYPDIIQTTFNNDENDSSDRLSRPTMAKENSDLESLVADSLENLAEEPKKKGQDMGTQQEIPAFKRMDSNSSTNEKSGVVDDKPFKAFDSLGTLNSSQQSGLIMSGSSMMTESQMGGLFAVSAPEAWVIDFNSLSMESEMESTASHRKSESGGSNSNSLAFFVNIDDCKSEANSERRGSGESGSLGGEKKMFSMFVDMRESEQGQQSGSSSTINKSSAGVSHLRKPVVNKPVMNIMETSTGSLKSMNKRFPSPIFQHKAAAEAARQAARLEWEKQKEKYYDSLEPTSILMGMGMPPPSASSGTGCGGGGDHNISRKCPMGESTVSNRSSLHVANVLESSFSSSIISSMEASQATEMEICQGGPCFKLGKDLIRMFQEGINTDVNINVNGKWIKAHKCILASRSQYFAAILSGHWVEKAGNTINLDGFSYSVVQFALYHIYSGTNEIPDTIDLMELATLTDLLGLEGLRENISQTFRVKFCHNFHRPCTGCITGVLECFPIAGDYGMDELHRKMTKWICKHFVRIWPTKGFASLGDELVEKCLRYSVNHLSVDNILDHTLGCDQLLSTMPTLRWTEPIFSIVNQLAAECVQYVGEHLCDVLQSQKFLQFGKGQAWNISRIEGTFMQAMTLLKPDEACLSHTALARLVELGTLSIDEVEWSTSFMDFLKTLRDEVEKFLFANASKAVLSRCWEQLGQDIRKKICNTSFVGYDKFGNKIVKNTGASTGARTSTRQSSTSQSNNPNNKSQANTMKSRQSSIASSNTMTKVASVRPMPSQTHNVESPVTPTAQTLPPKKATNPNTSSRPSSASKSTRSTDQHSTRQQYPSSETTTVTPRNTLRANPNKAMSMDREKSFNSINSRRTSGNSGSTAASSTASANRTPMKPLTPSVPPSKPSPLSVGYDHYQQLTHHATATASSSNKSTTAKARNPKPQPQPKPQEPPKKTFVSNSAKAAAVSKPLLKQVSKKTPTSSISSLNSQQGTIDPQGYSATTTTSKYNSRYSSTPTSSLAVRQAGGFSARSSFSNVERPAAVKSKVDSNPPRRNTVGQSQGHTTIPTKVRRPVSSGNPIVRGTMKHPGVVGKPSGHSSMPPVPVTVPSTASFDFDSLNDSYSRDNVMSRSTIETESGEVKMRTLAEIGRSSTFSKDEPTILGKLGMDGSGYGNIDMDYDEYE